MNVLAPETLQKIFQYLNWNDLKTCSIVCKDWEPIANRTTEQKWKNLCKSEFGQVYEKAYYKSRLSWQELYKSLRLWSQVKSSKIYLHYSEPLEGENGYVPLDTREQKKIQVLKNGVIGYPRYVETNSNENNGSKKCSMARWGSCNSISYYDPETLHEIDRVQYNFIFDLYEENEDLKVMRGKGLKLYIVTKINNQIHNIGEMVQYEWGDYSKFYLVGNKVFYLSKDYKIWMSKLVFENGQATIKTAPYVTFDLFPELNHIEAVAYISDNQINLLTSRGHIYAAIDQQLHKLCHVKKKIDNRNEVINMLKHHGFDWSMPEVYQWICSHDINGSDWVAFTHLKNVVVHSYDRVVFIGTSRRSLHIYYNQYINSHLKLYNRRPTLKVDLNEHVSNDGDEVTETIPASQRRILQIETMEIENGHRVIMLCCQRLVVVEFRHDPPRRPGEPLDHDHLATRPRSDSYYRIG